MTSEEIRKRISAINSLLSDMGRHFSLFGSSLSSPHLITVAKVDALGIDKVRALIVEREDLKLQREV